MSFRQGFSSPLAPAAGQALPTISFAAATLNAAAASGSAAGQASATGGHGGSWSLTTTAPLAISASTGALTTTGAVSRGSYSASLIYTFSSGGETYTVSETVAIVVAVAAASAVTAKSTLSSSLGFIAPFLGAY